MLINHCFFFQVSRQEFSTISPKFTGSIEASKNTHGIKLVTDLTCWDGVAQMCATPPNTLKFVQDDNSTESGRLITGTYCNPDLVSSIAGWISHAFDLKLSWFILMTSHAFHNWLHFTNAWNKIILIYPVMTSRACVWSKIILIYPDMTSSAFHNW